MRSAASAGCASTIAHSPYISTRSASEEGARTRWKANWHLHERRPAFDERLNLPPRVLSEKSSSIANRLMNCGRAFFLSSRTTQRNTAPWQRSRPYSTRAPRQRRWQAPKRDLKESPGKVSRRKCGNLAALRQVIGKHVLIAISRPLFTVASDVNFEGFYSARASSRPSRAPTACRLPSSPSRT